MSDDRPRFVYQLPPDFKLFLSTREVIRALCTGKNGFYSLLRSNSVAAMRLRYGRAGRDKWHIRAVLEAAELMTALPRPRGPLVDEPSRRARLAGGPRGGEEEQP